MAVYLRYNDVEKVVRYSYNAICDIEDELKMSVTKIFSEDNLGFKVLRVLLWAGLKTSDRNISIDRTGVIIEEYLLSSEGSIENLSKVCMDALEEAQIFGIDSKGNKNQKEASSKKK